MRESTKFNPKLNIKPIRIVNFIQMNLRHIIGLKVQVENIQLSIIVLKNSLEMMMAMALMKYIVIPVKVYGLESEIL